MSPVARDGVNPGPFKNAVRAPDAIRVTGVLSVLEGAAAPCYFVAVSARHLALTIAAVAVLAMGLYLFVQVRSTPAEAQVAPGPGSAAPRAHDPGPAIEAVPHPAATEPAPHPHIGPPVGDPVTVHRPDGQIRVGNDILEPSPEDQKATPRLDAIMEQANKAYDRQEFDEAKAIAGKILSKDPTNVRMLRVMVSSSCIDGSDMVTAQKAYDLLPKFDREQMRQRCDRYGVTFKEPTP